MSLLEQGSIVDFAVAIDAKLEAKIRNRNKGFLGLFIFDSRVLAEIKQISFPN